MLKALLAWARFAVAASSSLLYSLIFSAQSAGRRQHGSTGQQTSSATQGPEEEKKGC